MIPERYESQRVGLNGYRVLNLDLDGVCADYMGGLRDYLVRHDRMDPSIQPSNESYALYENEGWPFSSPAEYIAVHKAAEAEHLYATMRPLPGISEAMKTLAAAHVYIRVVTHRLFVSGQHRMVVADTAQWLDDNDIPYMSLCLHWSQGQCAGDGPYRRFAREHRVAARGGTTRRHLRPAL